jgi:NarL family two-component system response regulator YdfI
VNSRISELHHGGIVPKQILIVDDSSALRRMVRCWIEEKTDWKVCGEAENGKVAVRLAHELQPDLVLLDLVMPVMNGLEAARRIASVSPHPVMLMFTTRYSGQLVKEAEAAGIKEVLSKADAGINHLLASMKTLLHEPPADAA